MSRRGLGGGVVVLLCWVLASALAPTLLPGPLAVAERLPEIVASGPGGNGLTHLGRSLLRVAVATAVGLAVAVPVGVAMAVDDRIEAGVSVWLPFWMTIPTLVVVLVGMVLFSFSDLSVVAAVVVAATPFATVSVHEGAADVDRELLDMAAAFGVDRRSVLREIYLPAILPAVFGSARYLLSMVWKIVVLAETFGMNRGMGALFRFWFNEGDLTALLAALALFVGVMVALQAAVTGAERRLFHWREDVPTAR
ncbi:ABC transporter permease subunit [Natronomonas sp. F2-12]|jgi:NitT/TauT family transport system permease protein|uniref:ABC transporter permease subunit n=1 Tax=Natronomonas aquatica TaxID=2841590 RepID=A0A9R1CUS1_9EURY|nr:ABC transporter permease subunit [Natronomonas aquatica]MCQ4334137.1 ABC transporter permease subunit [Natronomonas aquatica]